MILRADATSLPLADESVACVVSSPPYNLGIDYTEYSDDVDWLEYEDMARAAAGEIARVLIPGGRAWINIMSAVPFYGIDTAARAPLGTIWHTALASAGLHYRDTVAWIQDSFDGGCAWGSYLMPSAPNLRGGWEAVLVFYRDEWRRATPPEHKGWRDNLCGEDGKTDWPDLTRNVWKIRPARKAPQFPIELPRRCIRLSTWPGEVVLDPFCGTGVTVEAAEQIGRRGIGCDIDAGKTRGSELEVAA